MLHGLYMLPFPRTEDINETTEIQKVLLLESGSQKLLAEAGARVSAVPSRRRRRRRHSPQPQLPSAGGVGGVAGWRMLLPTEGRGRNGNRNHGRRLTEPPAPLTEGEREAARAGQ